MPKSYHYIYKYLILYIVLSFIDNNNKYIINCQKIRKQMKLYEEMSNDILCENGKRINVTDSSTFCNYTALAQKSEFQQEKHSDGVTCYTCVNVSDNHVCNKYAIDKPCKSGNNFCHTLHIMDPKGKSILVNKKCANETECTPHTIGCYHIDNQKICISCCDENYCNRKVPTQTSNATFKNSRTFREKHLKPTDRDTDPADTHSSDESNSADAAFSFISTALHFLNALVPPLIQTTLTPH